MKPEDRFERLVEEFAGVRGATPPDGGRGFGSSALRIDGKIFAMLVRERLVVKLPKQRVDELVGAGSGIRFDANKGTPMKEWFCVDATSNLKWTVLAHEALEFVAKK